MNVWQGMPPLFARKELEVSYEQRLEMYRDAVSEEEIKQLIEDEGKGNAFAGSMLRILAGVRLSTSSSPLDKWIWQLVKKHLKPKKPRSRPRRAVKRPSKNRHSMYLELW